MLSCFSSVRLFAILWLIACQAALSMGFSRQEHWSGLPLPSPGDLSKQGIEPASLSSLLHWEVDSLPLVPPEKPRKWSWKVETSFTQACIIVWNLFIIREGSGNPLQCSCLENPRDGGAWWAAVYGVA